MNIARLLSRSRGNRNLLARIITVFSRFGFSPKKFEKLLEKYVTITHSLGCMPTFAVTAVILARHPDYIQKLSQQGVEFAIHGYVHIDYKMVSLDEQVKHFKKAMDTFKICGIPFVGFRAPFLRVNGHATEILNNLGFMYHSHRIIHWPVIDLNACPEYARDNHDRLLEFYTPLDASKYLALPRLSDGIVDIPVSVPDDECMVDRLGITDERKISEIWQDILRRTYSDGELFTVALHPERILLCEVALVGLLQQAKALKPLVWVATLGEVAEWWKEKDNFAFEIDSQDDGRYRVKAKCLDRATILLKNCKVNVPASECFDGYQSVTARDFVIESRVRPVIGVDLDSSATAVSFLESEGFVVERSHQADDYGIYIDNLAQFQEADEKSLSERVEQSDAPLLRYWRWPHQAKSALSITGDIDSITIIDFALRILENWRQNRRVSADGARGSF